MAQRDHYSFTDLENMMPYELELYFALWFDLIQKQQEEKNG